MPLIPVVFVALVLQHVGIGCIAHLERDGQRPDQSLWIVKGDLELHVPEIHAPESLGYAHLLGMRMAHSIKPGPVIEPRALHDQNVAFPVSDRVSPPGGIWISRKLASVQVDLPVVTSALVKQCVCGSSRRNSATRFKNSASAAGRKIASSFNSWMTS